MASAPSRAAGARATEKTVVLTRCLPRGIHGTRLIMLALTTTVAEGWMTDGVYPSFAALFIVRRARHGTIIAGHHRLSRTAVVRAEDMRTTAVEGLIIQTRNTLIAGGDIHMATVSVRYIVNDIDAAIGFYTCSPSTAGTGPLPRPPTGCVPWWGRRRPGYGRARHPRSCHGDRREAAT
jgi:hypothetical protein